MAHARQNIEDISKVVNSDPTDNLTRKIKRIDIDDKFEKEAVSSSLSDIKLNYEFIDDEDSLKRTISAITEAVRDDPVLAIDLEGDNLSRKGVVLLLSVATRTKAFLIDIKALKAMPFETGLRGILEDASVQKLMFDCREDADALLHQFQIKLDGVIDIQLLDVMKNPFNKATPTSGKRSERHEEVFRIRSLLDCIKTHLKEDKKMIEQKKKGKGSLSDWYKRPLEKAELEYAVTDVLSLFNLFDKLKPGREEMKRLKIASAIYVDMKRSKVNRRYDQYENNAFLPIDVIPRKGETTFESGYTLCTTCYRRFPRQEFSNTQLNGGVQKCRTCKRVKLEDDARKSYTPPTSFRRLFGYDYGYSYYESDDDYEIYYDLFSFHDNYDSDW